jgi:hypothetical protein
LPHIRPLVQERPIAVEDLDAVVLAVRHKDPPVSIHDQAVREGELTGPVAPLTPRLQQSAVWREAVHSILAVTVRDIYVAGRGKPRPGGLVER